MNRLARIRIAKLSKCIEVFSYVAIIAGVIGAYWEYGQYKERAKSSAALTYVFSFNEQRYVAAKYFVFSKYKNYDLKRMKQSGISDSVLDRFVTLLVQKNPGLEESIILLTDFFDGVNTCLKTNLCDEKIIEDGLSTYANSLYCLFSPVIVSMRVKYEDENFGLGLEKVAMLSKDCK